MVVVLSCCDKVVHKGAKNCAKLYVKLGKAAAETHRMLCEAY
jgi:hypothetical protein